MSRVTRSWLPLGTRGGYVRQGADGLKLTNMAGSACLRAEPNRRLPKLLAVPLGLSVRDRDHGTAGCSQASALP